MLSQSHPVYLSQLRTAVGVTKQATDKALIFLTIVSIGVLCVQTLIGTAYDSCSINLLNDSTGVFSINITVPTNRHDRQNPYNVFGAVLAMASLILFSYLAVVRRWWMQAKRRSAAGAL
jgi:magnesium transporter